MKKLLSLFIITILITSCHQKQANKGSYSLADMEEEIIPITQQSSNGTPPPINKIEKQEVIKKKIIKDGRLGLRVLELQDTKSRIDTLVKSHGGYYANENFNNSDWESSYILKIRIPSANFEKFITYIETGNGEIIYKEIDARDVTDQFIDLETRLENKRNYLIRYNDLLKKANSIKEILEVEEKIRGLEEDNITQVDINLLNQFQTKALEEIKAAFETKQVALIHGITASGKTEIYIHLIDEIIKTGKQALYLVPEIALTTQIIRRLKNVFGNKVGIYHSRLNSQERVEVWEKTLLFQQNPDKGFQVILGARSAVFLPFSELGLVIVDEEHENSFKQFDPAPRYNARDMAVVLGTQSKAKVLLGSATPSYESYRNALIGKYGLVNLNKRHANLELPEIIVSDLKRAYKRREMHSVLTRQLFDLVEDALENKEQVILFQNRRGYSPYVECFSCGYIPKCTRCDVSLTYHKYKKQLTCHYCGYSILLPDKCDECGSSEIKTRGFGTEKIEDELKQLFRNAKIDRMDLDTTRSKNAFEKIVKKIESRKTDILIGTQMVTKGLDFEHVSIVGILNADNLINFPDFRAYERAYQLISQVAGRAGRKHKRGKVVLQTSQPDHPLIDLIKEQDYGQTLKMQFEERQLFKYPPFYRLIKIMVKHKNADTVERVAKQLAGILRTTRSLIILGPVAPIISRIQLWHQKEILIKLDKQTNPMAAKKFISNAVITVKNAPSNSNCQINIDVDPY